MASAHRSVAVGALCPLSLSFPAGGVQVGVHSTVAADGTIDEYRVRIDVSKTAYGLLEEGAAEQGHDSVEAYVLAALRRR